MMTTRGLAPLLGLAAMFGEPAIGFSRPIPSDGPKVRYNRRNEDSEAVGRIKAKAEAKRQRRMERNRKLSR